MAYFQPYEVVNIPAKKKKKKKKKTHENLFIFLNFCKFEKCFIFGLWTYKFLFQ